MIEKAIVDQLLERVRQHYPDWDGFQHAQFVADEVAYKRKTAQKAQDLLGHDALRELLDGRDYLQIIERIKTVGGASNLLWLRMPSRGDLNVLHVEGLDQQRFCEAFFELVHGAGPADSRLDAYFAYIREAGIPSSCVKWAFPTYFLFFCHPESEFFVKPSATRDFLSLLGASPDLATAPSGESYASICHVMNELRAALEAFGPQDMIDIQSLVWVCASYGKNKAASSKAKGDDFAELYAEFVESYLTQEVGQDHARRHSQSREEGRKNFEEAIRMQDAGEDVTDFVLLKLLPHSDTPKNTERGAWISIAPALNGDIRTKFENAGWVKAEDWPAIAAAILEFVNRCQSSPRELRDVCLRFAGSPHSKGLKAGMLSPILNAVNPDEFYLVNKKAYRVVNHFAGTNFKLSIQSYPDVLETQKQLIGSVEGVLQQHETCGLSNPDLFDMFAHWMSAEKKYYVDSEESGAVDTPEMRYWKIAPGPSAEQWGECFEEECVLIGWDELGDISALSKKEFDERRDQLAARIPTHTKSRLNQVWKFAKDVKIGDRVIANRGTNEVVGIGTIVGDYYFKSEGKEVKRRHRRKVRWDDTTPRQISEGGWKRSLIEISREKFEEIEAIKIIPSVNPPYPLSDCAEETGIALKTLERWIRAINRKGQAIIYGPPGTGKTYVAERLAKHLIAGGRGIKELVQFHPAYAYEDFIQGIRPETRADGSLNYTMVPGRFLEFCRKAETNTDAHVLIIDEINRANLSRVFGELMYLLEYRDQKVPLAGGGALKIPPNVRIIGTMNTADRSIALVDHALRRRFAFLDLFPDFNVLRRFHAGRSNLEIELLVKVLSDINNQINNPHYAVGISYFLEKDLAAQLEDIWRMEIQPYLEEYFFDQRDKASQFAWDKIKSQVMP